MKKKEAATHAEKMLYVEGYMRKKPYIDKLRKKRKVHAIMTAVFTGLVGAFALFNYVIAAYVFVFGMTALVPFFYVFTSKMWEEMNEISSGPVNYRYFKKMKKSGELDILLKEYEINQMPTSERLEIKKFIERTKDGKSQFLYQQNMQSLQKECDLQR